MEILFFIPFLILLLIAVSMIAQGWMIVNEKYGYTENPDIKGHPEMKGVRKGDGLLVVNFDKMPENDYSQLSDRINRLKLEELLEEDDDDDGMAGVC
jgi:hypothetical protein